MLTDLYDPDAMPPDLSRVHSALDRVVDRLYRHARFNSERDHMEHLFELYGQMQVPLAAKAAGKWRRGEEALSSLRYRESHSRFNSRNFSLVLRVGSTLTIDASISSIS